ncbi:MAG: hypothetical protein MK171_01725 [Pirellulales bacterium]|nr:hypothetical protein [Pirellulales bacterium]
MLGSVQALAEEAPITPRALPAIDQRRAEQAGLRRLESDHLTLYTDLPASAAIDELPVVFDAAVAQWAKYFNIAPQRTRAWRMRAFLINDRAKFAALGLLPRERPDFKNGFATEKELWIVEQPSDYYRRHLLLHEGTHGFMHAMLGGAGPGWYSEGMAELFATHTWQAQRLHLRQMPADRQVVPMWGRIKIVREAHDKGTGLPLLAVLQLDQGRRFSTGEYAWCWALCTFLDSHLDWQATFRQLPQWVTDRDFNGRFRELFRAQWPELLVEWQAFIAELDYGYEARRMAMQHRSPVLLQSAAQVTVAADRGWQSTGWMLQAGREYKFSASGRYMIAHDTAPWFCEPEGVTLRYHAGQPLGKLLGVLRSEDAGLSPTLALGLGAVLKPKRPAVLYLRVNDSPARLSDNRGELTASIAPDQPLEKHEVP